MTRQLENPIHKDELKKLSSLELVVANFSKDVHLLSSPPQIVSESSVFVSDLDAFRMAIENRAGVIIYSSKLSLDSEPGLRERVSKYPVSLFSTKNVSQAMAEVLALVDPKRLRWVPGVSLKASVHPTARIGKNVCIGDFAVIGEGASVGDYSVIAPHTVIERKAQVGQYCFFHPFVMVGAECIVGDRVEIHSHTTIGSDGFGFVPQPQGEHKKIPQIGIVALEDDVEIGANCAIDRATIGETRICRGSKFDNLVHIAHNCYVGPYSRLAAGFFLAGSSRIGAHFLTGGSTVVTDHVEICDNVTLGGKSGVTKDIKQPGVYAGYPLEPLKDAMKTVANLAHLTTLRRQVAEIRRKLGLNNSDMN